MKATELRIGNIVSGYGTNGSPEGWVDIVVNAEHIKTCVSNPEWFKPIELTEERLVKFGFENYRNDIYWDKDGAFYMFKDGKLFLHDPDRVVDISIGLEFVHAAQNFHFALTGKEL